ncbi:MAG TPA: TonB-dependent receptor [Caulobacterales bacterium]|nr:TonB-dependent receptor [Caulobacterales bacterium]
MRHVFLISLSLWALSSTGALADDDEVVVTATRAPTIAQRLPAEVDIIDADAARARGDATLADALRETPGLGIVASGGAGQQTSLFAGGGNSNHTLVLYDGLRINDPSTPGSAFDAGEDTYGELQRIEVVLGPMSALYGSDAIGGVVNLIPRHGGPGPFNARLDASTGAFGTVTGAAGVDGAFSGFRYAVTAEGYASDGYDLVPKRMSTRTGERDGAAMNTLTSVFDLAVSPGLSLDLLARQRRARADFDPFPFDFLTFQEFRGEDDNLQIAKNDLTLARLGATWTMRDALSLRATYGGLRQKRVQRDDGADTDIFNGDRRFGDLTLTWRPSSIASFDDVAFVVGASDERETVNIAQGFGFPPPSSFTVAHEDHDSAFATAEGRLARLTLTGAVRVDAYDGFGTHTTSRFGASYAFTDALSAYAAWGDSFRAPTLYERFVSFGDPELDPERGESWEVGANARRAAFAQADGVELRALYRHTNIRDLIDFGPFFTYANVDRARIETAEARIALHPLAWLHARIAYVYTDARDVGADTPLLRRPRDAWSAELEAERGPFHSTLSWRQVGQRADQVYGDDGFASGVGVTPGYEVVRASAAYRLNASAEIYLAADNLLDETYEPVNAYAGAPRNITFGVRLRHGS